LFFYFALDKKSIQTFPTRRSSDLKIEEELNLDIKHDQELIMGLGLHLKPAINRYKYGMNFRNPMLADIKKNYPLAFEAGVIAGLSIESKIGIEINENEIGY